MINEPRVENSKHAGSFRGLERIRRGVADVPALPFTVGAGVANAGVSAGQDRLYAATDTDSLAMT